MSSSEEDIPMDVGGCSMRNLNTVINELVYNAEDHPTKTSKEQISVEESIISKYDMFLKTKLVFSQPPLLNRKEHLRFLTHNLARGSQVSDASRAWIVFWSVNSLCLLKFQFPEDLIADIIGFIGKLQSNSGGFGGGPGQFPHLASTYAAVTALCSLNRDEAYNLIDRKLLYLFLKGLKNRDGSFIMHYGGEIDVRAVYCAIAVAKLTNIYTEELFENSSDWLLSCQNYEGGFGALPGMEAHGGYTHCSLAALCMLQQAHECDLQSLLKWMVNRQTQLEGGFNGRTNKLVDGCYSFWQGSCFALLHQVLLDLGDPDLEMTKYLFNHAALQEYILICCQNNNGGLLDKPSKKPDVYHTCYCLSGLSIAQHFICKNGLHNDQVLGAKSNELEVINPLFNITEESVTRTLNYFSRLKFPVVD